MKLIFMYRERNFGLCRNGDGDGYSINIYLDGSVYQKFFIAGRQRGGMLVKEVLLCRDSQIAHKVGQIIEKYDQLLDEKHPSLGFGDDGVGMDFIFGNKMFSGDNIERIDLDSEPYNEWEYSDSDIESIKFGNLILDIYDEILEVLRAYGIDTNFKWLNFREAGNEEKKVFDIAVSTSEDGQPLFGFTVLGSEKSVTPIIGFYKRLGLYVEVSSGEYSEYLLTDPVSTEGYRVVKIPEKLESL